MPNIIVSTTVKREVIDITERITHELPKANGLVSLMVQHTTAALTTADLDPGTDEDFLDFLSTITPQIKWRHPHDPSHAPDHLLASLIGPSVPIPCQNGELQLGTWQRIVLIEFDGPRDRQVQATFLEA